MENQQVQDQPPISENGDRYEFSEADLEAGMQFLRSAGFNPLTMTQIDGSGAASHSSDLGEAIKAMGDDIARKMAAIDERLASLESRSTAEPQSAVRHVEGRPVDTSTPAPEVRSNGGSTPTPTEQSLLWADRPVDEVPDYSAQITWDDEDDDNHSNSKLFFVSEGTAKLLRDSFSKAIPNPTRKQLREKNGDPRCPPTRVPKLDKMVRDRMSQGAVKLDRSLARLQAHCVDAAGPLAMMLELAEQGELSAERSVTLARLALRFVGNASVQISRERRKRAIEEMNSKLVELADKDSIYEEAPLMFGDHFAKEAKEREDQLRALDRATGRSQFQKPQNFYNRRPQGFRRGGGMNPSRQGPQYGTRGRFQPYQFRTARGKENFTPRGRGKSQ